MGMTLFIERPSTNSMSINHIHRFVLVFLTALCWFPLLAQTDEDVRNHIIIAIDERISGTGWRATDNAIREKVEAYLFQPITLTQYKNEKNSAKDIERIDTLYGGKPLYKDGDLLSIVFFSLGQDDKSMNSFTSAALYDKNDFLYIPYSDNVKAILRAKWPSIAQGRDIHDVRHSIFSIAIPQVLSRCESKEDYQLTNRTFVIIITDRSYSDKNYFDDIRDFTDQQFRVLGWHAITKSDIVRVGEKVSKDYFINWINQDERKYQFFNGASVHRTKHTDLYELQPNQEHLRMAAILQYPETVTATRGRFGKYRIDFAMSPEDAERFNVLHLEAKLESVDKGKKRVQTPLVSYKANSPKTIFPGKEVHYILGKKKTFNQIELRAWVNLKDGIYNATVLTPSKEAAPYLGPKGLNVIIPIKYEPKAKTAFGLIPLWNIFCFTGNQQADATIVNLLIIMLLVAALLYWIYRTRYYEPTIDEITTSYRNRE